MPDCHPAGRTKRPAGGHAARAASAEQRPRRPQVRYDLYAALATDPPDQVITL